MIAATSALPAVTGSTVIDGTTEGGFAGTPLVVLSGDLAGAGVTGLTLAGNNNAVRGLEVTNFTGGEAADRQGLIETLQGLEFVDPSNDSTRKLDPDTLTRIVRLMPPPLRDAREETPGEVKLIRIRDEPNPDQPTEYAVALPPEYHPLRSYPAVEALHGGYGPKSAVAWWAAEAARRGYIVIAPNYAGVTVYVPDASRAVGVASNLVSDDLRAAYVVEVAADYEKIRAQHASKKGPALISIAAARANAFKPDWSRYAPPIRI